ncbi:MAG TPA: hypothetical protein VHM26_05235, partial [Chitinophagaceae bacterium]|jgi:hypothetical protein|nr:hypothetical protein [Chitinophagaceae bacterium]
MKLRIKIIASVLLAVQAISPAIAATAAIKPQQSNQFTTAGFDFIRAHRQGKGASVAWGLSADNGVVGFTVQRTYEDPTDPYAFWEDLGSTARNGSGSYKYSDINVLPGSIHYRVIAQFADGTSASSEVVSIKIVSKG